MDFRESWSVFVGCKIKMTNQFLMGDEFVYVSLTNQSNYGVIDSKNWNCTYTKSYLDITRFVARNSWLLQCHTCYISLLHSCKLLHLQDVKEWHKVDKGTCAETVFHIRNVKCYQLCELGHFCSLNRWTRYSVKASSLNPHKKPNQQHHKSVNVNQNNTPTSCIYSRHYCCGMNTSVVRSNRNPIVNKKVYRMQISISIIPIMIACGILMRFLCLSMFAL